jgi:AcrR family transcriptional regulator
LARPRKAERGRQTRARIVEAATRLFREQGYLDTTMAAVAAEAGVAVQTLYLSFGSKGAILKAAHDVAIVGDDEPVPLLERPWIAQLRAEPDGGRALAILLTNALPIIERAAPIVGVIQAAAADPEVAEQLQQNEAGRFASMQTYARELAAKPGFAPNLSADTAADILYAVLATDVYRRLVIERHWSREQWKAWVHGLTATQFFPRLRSGSLGGIENGGRSDRFDVGD